MTMGREISRTSSVDRQVALLPLASQALCRQIESNVSPNSNPQHAFLHTFKMRLSVIIKYNTLAVCSVRSSAASLSMGSVAKAIAIVEPQAWLSISFCQHATSASTVCA
jgi:hypothetical protein